MRAIRGFAIAAILVLSTLLVPAFAQSLDHEVIYFTLAEPASLHNSDIVLPPGTYYLYQINKDDLHQFFLYRDDLRHDPIATVSTTSIGQNSRWYRDRTGTLISRNELAGGLPVVEGFNIAGKDGFRVIAVSPDRNQTFVRGR